MSESTYVRTKRGAMMVVHRRGCSTLSRAKNVYDWNWPDKPSAHVHDDRSLRDALYDARAMPWHLFCRICISVVEARPDGWRVS